PPGELWLSLWDYETGQVTHIKDMQVDQFSEDYNFSILDATVIQDGTVDILYRKTYGFAKQELIRLNTGSEVKETYEFGPFESTGPVFLHPNGKIAGVHRKSDFSDISNTKVEYRL